MVVGPFRATFRVNLAMFGLVSGVFDSLTDTRIQSGFRPDIFTEEYLHGIFAVVQAGETILKRVEGRSEIRKIRRTLHALIAVQQSNRVRRYNSDTVLLRGLDQFNERFRRYTVPSVLFRALWSGARGPGPSSTVTLFSLVTSIAPVSTDSFTTYCLPLRFNCTQIFG